MDNQTLVSVILITEDAADDDVFNVFKNITEQTHSKLDIIVSTFRDDIDSLKERCAELHLDVRWAQQSPGGDFIGELLNLVDGELVFYDHINLKKIKGFFEKMDSVETILAEHFKKGRFNKRFLSIKPEEIRREC